MRVSLRVLLLAILMTLLVPLSFSDDLDAVSSLKGMNVKNVLNRKESLKERPENFYPSYKWVYDNKIIRLKHSPLIYRGEVFLEQDDFLQILKVLGVRNWTIEKVRDLPDGNVEVKFVYNDIPPKRCAFEPLFYNGVFIPFKVLRETVGYEIVIDEQHSRIWVVPSLQNIILLKDAVVLRFAGRLKIAKNFYLSKPLRFVIDLDDAAVTKDLFREMKISDHRYLRSIRTSQFSIVPPIARVVLDLKPGVKVKRITKIKPNEIHIAFTDNYEAPLVTPKENPLPNPKEKPVNIYQITPLRDGKYVTISLRKSKKKVSFAIKKLSDGRTYVDLYNAVLKVGKNTLKVNYGSVVEIKYSQYQTKPIPVVRIVLYTKKRGELKLKSQRDDLLSFLFVPEGERGIPPLPKTAQGVVICIDPGHGGSDPGARGPYIDIPEKDITLSIGMMVYAELKKAGLNPIMTRYTDRDVLSPDASDSMELQARVDIAEKAKARAFISIHINASPNRYLDGIMTFYHKDTDYPLAFAIHSQLASLGIFRDRGIRKADFYVLRKTTMPSVLVELGFISNKDDAMKLASLSVRRKLARAIARGIIDFLSGRSEVAE